MAGAQLRAGGDVYIGQYLARPDFIWHPASRPGAIMPCGRNRW